MQGQTSSEQDEKMAVDAGPEGIADAPSDGAGVGDRVRTRSSSRTNGSRVGQWVRNHTWQLLSALLALLLAIAVGVAAYLWHVSDQWERRSSDLTTINEDLAEELVAEQIEVLTQAEQIALLEDQRATLQTRVLDLADAVSQSGDSAATAEQQISVLTGLISTASSVTNGLNRCIDGKTQLAEYMATPEDYAPEELEAFATSVDQLCTVATNANIQFQQQLSP